jgi:rSAM/selenodomain-associated transferase 2
VLDEERRIGERLSELSALAGLHEVIVVDGGSRDRTLDIARAAPGVRLIEAPRGRGRQLNAGARVATGNVLLFLHADVSLPSDALAWIERTLSDPPTVAGAFRTWTIADTEATWLGPLLHLADVRSRYSSLPYGDQAVFVRREAFETVGGFPDEPIMEDLALARALRRLGRIVTVPASVRVSGRRFIARPFGYTFLVNVFPLLYRLGVPPRLLAQLYGNPR